MVHFADEEEVKTSGRLILSNIAKLAKIEIKNPIQLHLRGGIEGDPTNPVLDILRTGWAGSPPAAG